MKKTDIIDGLCRCLFSAHAGQDFLKTLQGTTDPEDLSPEDSIAFLDELLVIVEQQHPSEPGSNGIGRAHMIRRAICAEFEICPHEREQPKLPCLYCNTVGAL